MAGERRTGEAIILQFRQKSAPPKKTANKKTRIARRLSIFPSKEKGKECAFRKTCDRECVELPKSDFSEATKKKLRRDAEDQVRWFNVVKHPSQDSYLEKIEHGEELRLLLDGIVIPPKGNDDGFYSMCGTSLPGMNSMRAMQAYSNSQIREALKGMEFGLDLEEAYASLPDGPVSGLHPQIAGMVSKIANVQLPENRKHLEILIRDGGTTGIRQASWMLGEFIIPHEVRMEYLGAMEQVVSCASFDFPHQGKNTSLLAIAISRFCPLEEQIANNEGLPGITIGMRKRAPPMLSRPDIANLRGMISFSIGEFIQSIVDMSSRLDSLFLAPKELAKPHLESAGSIFIALESAVSFLCGKEMPNKKLLEEECGKKAGELAGIDPNPGEQAIARHLIKRAAGQGNTEKESVDALLEALNAEGESGVERIRELGLET